MMRRCFLNVFLLLIASPLSAQKADLHTAEEPLAPAEAAATMRVPEGFRVTLFAGEPDVMQPIGFCIDDRGRLWVAEAYNYPVHGTRAGDRIVILEDVDGDGRHDKRTVFYDQLNYVSGIEVGFGGAWVMSPPFMYFIPDQDGDDAPDSDPVVLLDGFGTHANAHNIANGFAWGPDGWLYATHGRTNWSMIGKPGSEEPERRRFDGGVWRYHPVRHVWEPYADGTTNPWGIDWNDYGDAFVCNCVNPHLFQVIQGAHYEPWRGRKNSQYAYQRIDTIADHLHFVGLGNVRNGLGSDDEDNAGGGHAHCGTIIYLGDQFPASYRNQLFTNNIHGRRINNDLLRPSGSGYIASHGPDLMRSLDPWFMGVTLACGPSGEVFVSDWSDTGECHSTRNTRRHTGRIYRMTYLENEMPRVDLRDASNAELVAMQMDENDWKVRHARRLLHERSAAGEDMSNVHDALRSMLQSNSRSEKRLRALWALQVTGGLNDDALVALLDDEDAYLRSWAVTLLCEDRDPPLKAQERILKLARHGGSPRVRLAIASALQRLEPDVAWTIVEALASHGEDQTDQNLPLMVWYAAQPLIDDDLERFAELSASASIPRVAENAARRIAESRQHQDPGLTILVEHLPSANRADAIMRGILIGLEGQRNVAAPKSWAAAYRVMQADERPEVHELAIKLAMVFRDQEATDMLRQTISDAKASAELRRTAIEALASNGTAELPKQLIPLLDDNAVCESSLRALSRYADEETDEAILKRYRQFSDSAKQVALQVLASRRSWARELMTALQSGLVPSTDLTAMTARQLDALGDPVIDQVLGEVWGELRSTPLSTTKQISAMQRMLSVNVLTQADLARGKSLFTQHCGNCHRFFGEGGNVGPDLTGAQRTNLAYLLENMIDPSASVAKEYRMQIVRTVDGRVVSGLIESETEDSVTIATGTDRFVIPVDEIEERKQSEVSVMPNNLLEPLSDRDIRDLIGYLQR